MGCCGRFSELTRNQHSVERRKRTPCNLSRICARSRGGAVQSGRSAVPSRDVSQTAMTNRPIRVLVAKPGLDGHDRGAKIVARALRDAGMEVIYTGLRQTPEQIVNAALQEDVDAIGISILSGAHNTLLPRICQMLREQGMDDVLVVIGGIIPHEDIPFLKQAGVAEVFQPGASTQGIVDFIRSHARRTAPEETSGKSGAGPAR